MKITVNIRPLAGEFWPLEGVMFESRPDHSQQTVLVRLHGNPEFKDCVDLRFLFCDGLQIDQLDEPGSLQSFALTGSVESINTAFLGFGLVFNKDCEYGENLSLQIIGSSIYIFLIELG